MTKKEEKEILTYTTILHQARQKLNLSLNEYCIADTIYHLQNNPSSKVKGWCYASKKTIGGYIGLTEQSAHSIINSLMERGIIEKDEETRHLRTTNIWYENVILLRLNSRNLSDTKETLVPHSRKFSPTLKNLESNTKETLDNNNSINIDNNKDNKNLKKNREEISKAKQKLKEKGVF